MNDKNDIETILINLTEFLKDYFSSHHRPPTIREIANALDIKSTSTVAYYLKKLEQREIITVNSQLSRGIRLNTTDFMEYDFHKIPLIGEITAGDPILAEENFSDIFVLSKNLFSNLDDSFMLKVTGSSMIEIGINDGDYIIIKKQNYALNGQIVAALIDNDLATIKRYFNDEFGIRLHPENKDMQDIYPENLQIIGIVRGLIRTEVK